MKFERITTLAAPDGHNIPAYLLAPDSARGGAALIPPYGSTKEQMLGIAATLGDVGIVVLSIDLCGHGENRSALGPMMRDEVESAVGYVRRFGRAAAVGVSLGGRPGPLSSAHITGGISPTAGAATSVQGKWGFENFSPPPARGPPAGDVNELFELLCPAS